ncbi:MAG: hypothetical protein MR536_07335 [Prevotella sp.]|nr:hypothetical protein [Prevotella sp.]MDD7461251.1 hypothetical protein [Prevotellaceae bacterium]MDY3366446.1 hypothetical protein [Prevotella sp.]MDY3852062.1 hypothetical protein [Prevotella sp.]
MSEKSKQRQAKRAARQEQEGKKVMAWLVGGLVFVAILSLILAMQFA